MNTRYEPQPLGVFPITSHYGAGRSRTESESELAAADLCSAVVCKGIDNMPKYLAQDFLAEVLLA